MPEQLTLIPTSKIEQHPLNPRGIVRKADAGISELAVTIRKHGVKQNLRVRSHPDKPGRYQVFMGHRRLTAAKVAGLPEVPCVVEEIDDATAVELMLVENDQRADLSDIQRAQSYHYLMMTCGRTRTQVANKIGCTPTHVTDLVGLLNLPRWIKEKIQSGLISGRCLLIVSRIATSEQMNEAAKLVWNDGNPLSVRVSEKAVREKFFPRRRKNKKSKPKKSSPLRTSTVSNGKVDADTKTSTESRCEPLRAADVISRLRPIRKVLKADPDRALGELDQLLVALRISGVR